MSAYVHRDIYLVTFCFSDIVLGHFLSFFVFGFEPDVLKYERYHTKTRYIHQPRGCLFQSNNVFIKCIKYGMWKWHLEELNKSTCTLPGQPHREWTQSRYNIVMCLFKHHDRNPRHLILLTNVPKVCSYYSLLNSKKAVSMFNRCRIQRKQDVAKLARHYCVAFTKGISIYFHYCQGQKRDKCVLPNSWDVKYGISKWLIQSRNNRGCFLFFTDLAVFHIYRIFTEVWKP